MARVSPRTVPAQPEFVGVGRPGADSSQTPLKKAHTRDSMFECAQDPLVRTASVAAGLGSTFHSLRTARFTSLGTMSTKYAQEMVRRPKRRTGHLRHHGSVLATAIVSRSTDHGASRGSHDKTPQRHEQGGRSGPTRPAEKHSNSAHEMAPGA